MTCDADDCRFGIRGSRTYRMPIGTLTVVDFCVGVLVTYKSQPKYFERDFEKIQSKQSFLLYIATYTGTDDARPNKLEQKADRVPTRGADERRQQKICHFLRLVLLQAPASCSGRAREKRRLLVVDLCPPELRSKRLSDDASSA